MGELKITIPKERIESFCKRWKVRELSIFGSAVREDFSKDSDLDILVSFYDDAGWSLADLVEMQMELEEIFGREVDLVEQEAIRNPFRRREILANKETIYVA